MELFQLIRVCGGKSRRINLLYNDLLGYIYKKKKRFGLGKSFVKFDRTNCNLLVILLLLAIMLIHTHIYIYIYTVIFILSKKRQAEI